LNQKNNEYERRAMNLSTKEREFADLFRQKEIKSTLVTYLLQKREETGLSQALATPNAIVIDKADYFPKPVSPKTKIVLLLALIFGVVIPVGVIYVLDLLDNKVRSKEQLMRIVTAPFLGEVFLSKSTNPFPVLKVRSGIAEKFRIIASHLGFIATGEKKVIMITSSYSGEGKSFFSRNLAMSLATSGKKVLLVDLDMRKSQMNKNLDLKREKGIAWFLSDPNVTIEEVIDHSAYHKNLDIIPTKFFPPNPAELIASQRLDLFFQSVVGKYDYVIVDTAPIGLVADAFRVNQYVDATIFVVRENYTFKSTLKEIEQLYNENKLHHLTTVLNGITVGNHNSYGYGYGYGQHSDKHNYYTDDVDE
jgi:capsular exopolysaccharide synthesis family protein